MFKRNNLSIGKRNAFDIATFSFMAVGTIALLFLILFYVMPVKLADIKVPIATDKASYYQGQEVGGIFFGETFYTGEVRILREVYCKNYKGLIEPPEAAAAGDFYATQGTPRKLEGQTLMIGKLPKDVPVGSNCVIQFTNVYNIKTPFGTRHEEYKYYTQNFAIVTKETRDELDKAADAANAQNEQSTTGGNSDQTNTSNQINTNTAPSTRSETNIIQNNSTPPVVLKENCTIDLLGIKLGCRQEAQ